MSIQVIKSRLSAALASLTRIVPSKSSNPLLTSIHVQITAQGLILTGTNLDLDLRITVPAEVPLLMVDKVVTVPAHLWAGIIGKLPGEIVDLELEEAFLYVRGGGSKTKIQVFAADEYPVLDFPTSGGAKLDMDELLKSISAVRYAAYLHHIQPVLRALKYEVRPDRTRLVASDGLRLALRDMEALDVDLGELDLLLPARSVDHFPTLFRTIPEVTLTPGRGLVTLTGNDLQLNVRLLDGEWVRYEHVIPKVSVLDLQVASLSLREASDRVIMMATTDSNNRIGLECSNGRIHLSAEGSHGMAEDEIPAELSGTEESLTVGFNGGYLLDAIRGFTGDMTLSLSGVSSPALFTSSSDSALRAVVMPLKAG